MCKTIAFFTHKPLSPARLYEKRLMQRTKDLSKANRDKETRGLCFLTHDTGGSVIKHVNVILDTYVHS